MRAPLLDWYDTHRRDLPWRTTTDPYRIWVSEIMLQQTRVDVVIPYYERWLERFPTVEALAAADQSAVLKAWEGLGYYSRARNLHGAARVVRERFGGILPERYALLRALPGIGDYTAGAIASIAYSARTPAVDGNVRRVLSRLFDTATSSAATLRARADALVDPQRPGDFNQALMELGATVCTPRKPSCIRCPLAESCQAFARDTVARRPAPKSKRTVPHERMLTIVYLHRGRVLIGRRPQHGLLAGLWSFPHEREVPAAASHIGNVRHVFTHKRVTYEVHLCHEPRIRGVDERWVHRNALRNYALPSAQRKIERLVQEHEPSRPSRP